jgi:uncharacterized protein
MTDSVLEPLSRESCLDRLRREAVGRIAFVADGDPVVFPVNYRLVEPASGPAIAVRTRPGNVIERAPLNVAFEIDWIDRVHHRGWSVLVRGDLVHVDSTSDEFVERYDPKSWLADRESWLLIDPWEISGRELHGTEPIWPFRPGEYM